MDRIRERLRPQLEEMNRIIAAQLHTSNEVMNGIVTRYLQVKGKQIRPMMVILSAEMFGGGGNAMLLAGAALEMLHNASLIHDDVVDETALRRGVPTVNARMGNHVAVLTGDFFVANALAAGIRTGDIRVVSALSALGTELSLGEIDQLSNAREHRLDEKGYYGMIRQKTASLFVNCARMGAELAGASEEEAGLLARYAEALGLCFQIRDDIFDYFDDPAIGKPTGNDLREGKVTLPLLHALASAPEGEAAAMRALLERGDLSEGEIQTLIDFAKRKGGVEYAWAAMRALQDEARPLLDTLPRNWASDAYRAIFDYIIERTI